jgi:hypothetical protein
MSDIANELRERSLRAEQEGEPLALLDEAADEIARLRLTDEERTAIGLARSVFEDYKMSRLHSAADEVLERLLERTK